MMQQILKRPFSTWLHARLAAAPKHKTVALLVDKSEVETLDCLKPYSESVHFRQDLTLEKKHWIYSNDRRVLVVQQDSTEKDMAKHMRELGTLTCSQLQAKKSSDAEIICSSKVDGKDLGTFYNSFHLTNYEWSLKSDKPESEEKKDEEEADERLKRKTKLIDNFEVVHEENLLNHETFTK